MVDPDQAQLSQETVSALGALRSGDPRSMMPHLDGYGS